jgi:hypothetical protein
MVGQEHVVRALTQRARAEPPAPRLPVHRHARHRQDHGVAHPGQVAELHRARRAGRHHGPSLRRVHRLHRDRRRPLHRLHRARRGQQPQHRRDPRPDRARRLQAQRRPLQGLHDRRGAPAHQGRLQRAAEDAGRAAGVPEVRAGHDRPREDAAHGAEPLPAVQPATDGARGRARPPGPGAAGRGPAVRRRLRCACWVAPRAARCATRCR